MKDEGARMAFTPRVFHAGLGLIIDRITPKSRSDGIAVATRVTSHGNANAIAPRFPRKRGGRGFQGLGAPGYQMPRLRRFGRMRFAAGIHAAGV